MAEKKREPAHIEKLLAQWQSIESSFQSAGVKTKDLEAALISFVDNLNSLIAHVGDSSGLILDPDLDSYYLMDLVVLGLPAALSDLLKGVPLVREAKEETDHSKVGPGSDNFKGRVVLQNQYKNVHTARMDGDITTALSEDKNFYGTNVTAQNLIPDLGKAFAENLTKSAEGISQERPSLEETNKTAQSAADSAFALWGASNKALLEMLKARALFHEGVRNQAVSVTLLAVALATAFGVWTTRGVTKGLSTISELLSKTSSQVNIAASSLEQASGTLASGSQENAAAIEEVTATVESFSNALSQSRSRSGEAVTISSKSSQLVRENSEKMLDLLASMNDITKASAEVADITKLTGEIAFKTNLLALNAAVEAARAGESGKGFAVVADAVRTLASQSAEAAKQIESITKRNSSLSSTGTSQANSTQAMLQDVVVRITKLDTLLAELEDVFNEQESNAKQITQAVRQVDSTIQDSARVSEETAGLATELIDHSGELGQAVVELNALIYGSKAS